MGKFARATQTRASNVLQHATGVLFLTQTRASNVLEQTCRDSNAKLALEACSVAEPFDVTWFVAEPLQVRPIIGTSKLHASSGAVR